VKSIIHASWQQSLRWLIGSLATMMLALALISIAEFVIGDSLVAEVLALIAVILLGSAFFIGSVAFLLLIYSRLRDLLFHTDKEQG